MAELRALIIVLGDQLGLDAVWMAEVTEESMHVWSSKPRTAMFPNVDRRCASFSQCWARATRGLNSAADLLAVNEVHK